MSLALSLNAAIAGLQAAQNGLDVTSQNVANINTEGYTKKVHNQVSWVVAGNPAGVRTLAFDRVVDESLIKGLRGETGESKYLETKNQYMLRVVDLFGQPADNNSISHKVTDLKSAFDELSTNVSKISAQSNAVNAASGVASQFRELSTFLQEQRAATEDRIDSIADRMNTLLQNIDTLNTEISRIDMVGMQSSDGFKDQRDSALLELSGYLDITTFTRETGEVVVMTQSGTPLLHKDSSEISYALGGSNSAWTSHAGGEIGGFYAGEYDITNQIRSGELKGLIELRDETLPNMQSELDELAAVMRDELNQVNNSGTSFPSMTSDMTGSRTFMNSSAQTVRMKSGDVKLVITDSQGKQTAAGSLLRDLNMPAGGETVDEMAARMQTWLRDPSGGNLVNATVAVNGNGKFDIDLHSTEHSISFRDETSTDKGSEHQDAILEFDMDADGNYDTEHEGFSNFLGLNNLFDVPDRNWIYDSKMIGKGVNLGVSATATLSFSDEDGLRFGSINVEKNDTLHDIAAAINDDPSINTRLKATVVEENGQYRLRVMQLDSKEMAITEDTGTGLLDRLGIGASYVATSTNMNVRDAIENNPTEISKGAVQYDTSSGEYFVSAADNETAIQFSNVFEKEITFKGSGTLAAGGYTITDFATSFVSGAAEEADNVASLYSYQKGITDELTYRNAEVSGVNLDEELSQIMIYQNAYAAAARIISATQKLFDILDGALG
ncbi:MAG: flagellar hook-associated protein FlgK [Alphaproteobacteria bacterium]|nr:flagellar hook-associated protein FlgK [Alphaproteobacteria bacterium]